MMDLLRQTIERRRYQQTTMTPAPNIVLNSTVSNSAVSVDETKRTSIGVDNNHVSWGPGHQLVIPMEEKKCPQCEIVNNIMNARFSASSLQSTLQSTLLSLPTASSTSSATTSQTTTASVTTLTELKHPSMQSISGVVDEYWYTDTDTVSSDWFTTAPSDKDRIYNFIHVRNSKPYLHFALFVKAGAKSTIKYVNTENNIPMYQYTDDTRMHQQNMDVICICI